jgi:hypothetical protein
MSDELLDVVEENQELVDDSIEESSTSNAGQEPEDQRSEAELSLINELQGVRDELKQLKDTSTRYQQEVEYLRMQGQQPVVEEDYGDPDDFLVRDDAEKLIERKLDPALQQLRAQELNLLEAQAMAKYNDYEDVVRTYGTPLLDADPDLRGVILASRNPAETLYNLARSNPQYLKDSEGKTRKDTVNKINKNLSSTPTLASQGGSAVSSAKDWSTASDAEIDAKLAELGINY